MSGYAGKGKAIAVVIVAVVLGAMSVTGQEDAPRRASAKRPPAARKNGLLSPEALKTLFRPTVTIRNGNGHGTGTIISSKPGLTLILTASHVVSAPGTLEIEVNTYNLGIEHNEKAQAGSTWPHIVPAEVAAIDTAADVALVWVLRQPAFPYVARVDLDAKEPAPTDILTSVGVVLGTDLTGWRTDIQGQAKIDLARFTRKGPTGDPRVFTVTTKPPEFGRSGGGLFRPNGTIVGVAVGRLKINDGPEVGVFASMESIRRVMAQLPSAR